jgi:hypothetical protein
MGACECADAQVHDACPDRSRIEIRAPDRVGQSGERIAAETSHDCHSDSLVIAVAAVITPRSSARPRMRRISG